jgi:hypothetical protein
MPSAPINFENCFKDLKSVPFENLLLQAPLVKVRSSVDDLRIASVKADEIQQLTEEQELNLAQDLYDIVTSRWSILETMSLFFMLILCSCCCCRNCAFWLWDKWNLKECWQQTVGVL